MIEVLEYSINTGMVFVEEKLGHQNLLTYLDKFGIFEPTDIDLPGEVASQNKELKKGYIVNYATSAFGQGIEMTQMQLLKAYTAFANEGRLANPYLVQKVIEGDRVQSTESVLSAPVISSRTVSQITAMLVSVIENGFSKK